MKTKLAILAALTFLASAGVFWLILATPSDPDSAKSSNRTEETTLSLNRAKTVPTQPEKTVQVRMSREAMKQLLGPDAAEATSSARLVPVGTGQGVEGFKVLDIRSGGLFSRTGFKNQDVIVSLDGVKLDQPEMGSEIFNAFEGSTPSFFMDVQRGSSLIRLQFSYKD